MSVTERVTVEQFVKRGLQADLAAKRITVSRPEFSNSWVESVEKRGAYYRIIWYEPFEIGCNVTNEAEDEPLTVCWLTPTPAELPLEMMSSTLLPDGHEVKGLGCFIEHEGKKLLFFESSVVSGLQHELSLAKDRISILEQFEQMLLRYIKKLTTEESLYGEWNDCYYCAGTRLAPDGFHDCPVCMGNEEIESDDEYEDY